MKTMSLNNMPPSYFAKFILLFALLFIIIASTSCGTYKKAVNKQKHTEEMKTESEVKTKTDTNTETGTTRTITETFSTNIVIEEKTVSDSADLANLLNGEELIFENEDLKFITSIDSSTKKVKSQVIKKKQVIPIQGTKKTEEIINEKQHQTVNTDEKKKTESEVTDKSKVKDTVTNIGMPWYFWIVILILAFILIWMVLKRFELI